MKKYHLINNILGWGVCLIACIVYLVTAEPTASWWDCGEYIATADKLQVGHLPTDRPRACGSYRRRSVFVLP